MSILITGGAGFIGSHTARLFSKDGLEVVVLDNLTTGVRESVRWGTFVQGDLEDKELIRRVIRQHAVTAVIHLAASARTNESMREPREYFANNVSCSISLLDAMVSEGVLQFVFASSCSVYGDSAFHSADEHEGVAPVSPYGESKLAIERFLPWYERAYGMRWVALRYFNVAGAEAELGEDILTSVRIIPRVVRAGIAGDPPLRVFGTTFPTFDGSAVRDYVHVSDIANANLRALRFVKQAGQGAVINIGSGIGTSVLQIISEVSLQTGVDVSFIPSPASPGDPACAISDAAKARTLIGWAPAHSTLDCIVASVIQSHRFKTSR